MAKIVRSAADAVKAIRVLNHELQNSPHLASRLGQAHAYYVLDEETDEPLFGFSKFVGYEGLTAERYLREYKGLTGINTEHALSEWFEEVRYGSAQYKLLFEKLSYWMGHYGKRPRQGDLQKTRLMTLKREFCDRETLDEDRDLLNLIAAVVDRLPLHQRTELRALL